MNKDTVSRFLGGSPAGVVLRLVVLSFVVGVIMSAFGLSPFDIVRSLQLVAEQLYDTGFAALGSAWRYFLLGAVIVVPVFLLARLLRFGRRQA
jgi:hypothetical protein